jgi:hypothetical protein
MKVGWSNLQLRRLECACLKAHIGIICPLKLVIAVTLGWYCVGAILKCRS